MKFYQLTIILFLFNSLQAQVTFTEKSEILQNQEFSSGVAIGISDMNGDGLDDIIRLNNGTQLSYELQNNSCGKFLQKEVAENLSIAPFWNIAIGDINNDGQNDCMMSGTIGEIKMVINNNLLTDPTVLSVPNSNFFAQGANFIDINQDGYLDAFICDDNGESKIFVNDGAENFSLTNIIDLTTAEPSDNSGNYGSVWTDFDSDGDVDLYIAKCKSGVDSSEDPRRINMLFVNQGNGLFVESADQYNLAIGAQSWTADFGDLDNDGDQDCFITNHDVPCMVLENLGDSTFIDISQSVGVNISGAILQGVLTDFDNDGFLDILISGNTDRLFFNNGDMTFTSGSSQFGSNIISSFALGDLNNDGFQDIYAGYANGINDPSGKPDQIWMNDANGNNWVQFDLEGEESNRNGVGAKMDLYGAWGVQTRGVRAGESYGISLSHLIQFGLGIETTIDSAIITWPSGQIDILMNIEDGQQYLVKEGGCITKKYNLDRTCIEMCIGDLDSLMAPDGFMKYLWSNGDTSRKIELRESGLYYSRMTDDQGCETITSVVSVIVDPTFDEVDLTLMALPEICAGETIELVAPEASGYLWNTGDTTSSLFVSESGNYFATLFGLCSEAFTDTIEIMVLDELITELKGDSIFQGERAHLTSSNEQTRWYSSFEEGSPLFEGDTFITPTLDASQIYYASTFNQGNPGQIQSVGQIMHSGNSFYNPDQFNGAMYFDVDFALSIEGITVYTEFPGKRIIEIYDDEKMLIYQSDTLEIVSGTNEIQLSAFIQPGQNYSMTTNQALNNLELGTNNPKLYRSEDDFLYPFVIPNVLSITGTNLGEDFYYYFYDWKVLRAPLECESERMSIEAFVHDITSIEKISIEKIAKIYPNPAQNIIAIELVEVGENFEILITDILGRRIDYLVLEGTSRALVLDISTLKEGIYFITVVSNDKSGTAKILKVN